MAFVNPEYIYTVLCPNLRDTPHKKTSDCSNIYNCMAYAAGDRNRKWDPYRNPNERGAFGHWPDGCPQNQTLDAFQCAYRTLGFEPCESPDFEKGHEKIALYLYNDEVVHVALQRADRAGKWRSKLGSLEDLEHELHAIAGSQEIGEPRHYMRHRVSGPRRKKQDAKRATKKTGA